MKSEKERYTYTQLPSEPLPEGMTTFRVNLDQTAKSSFGIEFRGWQSEVKAEWKAFQQQWRAIVDEVENASPDAHDQWQFDRADTLVLPRAPQPDEYFFDPSEVQYALQLTGMDVGDDGLNIDVVVDPLNITEELVATKKEKVKRGEEMVEMTRFYLKLTYVQPLHITISARGVTLKSVDANTCPRTWSSRRLTGNSRSATGGRSRSRPSWLSRPKCPCWTPWVRRKPSWKTSTAPWKRAGNASGTFPRQRAR